MKFSLGIDTTLEDNRQYIDNKQDNRHDRRNFSDSRRFSYAHNNSFAPTIVCVAATGPEAQKLLQQSMKALDTKQDLQKLEMMAEQCRKSLAALDKKK